MGCVNHARETSPFDDRCPIFGNARLFANGGAWQTGVPVTRNAAASDQKKSTNVTIEDEKLTIDLHQEFASPL